MKYLLRERKSWLLLGFLVLGVAFQALGQSIISSFEKEKDFEHIIATEGVEFSRSTDFPALGMYSCKADYPENGGTIYLNSIETFFSGNIEGSGRDKMEVLQCFIWTNEAAQISLNVQDSSKQTFSKRYALKRGANHLQLRLSNEKKLDFQHLKSIGIQTEKKYVFYLDYVALDRYQPVLKDLGRYDVKYSTDIETVHYPWGSELAGGAIRSYAISPVFDGRGIIELAERLDLDFKVTTIGRTYGAEKYGFGDFYMRRSPGHGGNGTTYNLVHDYIAEDMLFGPELDVIIWPGIHPWNSYPLQIRNAILERVKNGTGLVLLYPISEEENSDLWDISPLKSTEAVNAQFKIEDREIYTTPSRLDTSKWSPTKSHYITRGIAFKAFPWGHMGAYPYLNSKGEVLVESAGGNPVLATSKYGKGRVVAFAYPERGFLPRVGDPWETGLHYPYWEYMWSMVAKSIVWAAGREPATFIKSVVRTGEGISAELVNVPAKASLQVIFTDEYGVIEEESSFQLDERQAQLNITFKNRLHGGRHIANARLIGEEGIFDWYSIVFQTEKPAEIISVENEKTEIPQGENVRSHIILKSNGLKTGVLTARLIDNYGRLVDQQVHDVSIEGEKSINIVFKSKNILSNLATVDITLHIEGNQSDRKSEEVFFLLPRQWDDYDITMYHFGPNPVPGTWPAVDRQLQNLDVTTLAAYTLASSKHGNYKVQAQTRIHGVESPDRGPDLEYYEEMLNKYLKTHDKYLLKRKYGLKDPVYLDSVRGELTTMIGEWKKFSPSAYYIYEEPSITRYDGALDLCFRESTLEAMRDWLKEEYENLYALNDQWGTEFSKWEEVIPDDTYEARKRGNYSSWADHRTFMEICWADQFKFVQNIVNEVDPGGLVQLSGTQAASSHNGYDYSRLDKYVGQMNPYDIDNQLEYHHNFNPELKISGQAGYGALGKGVLYDYYHHLFLKETGGAYIFWQVSSLNPDLRMCEAGSVMKEGMDEMLKRGIGRLVDSYKPENEMKIAIHFSYPSIHAAWIVDGEIVPQTGDNASETLKQLNRNRDGWVKVLHDMGTGFDFIAYSSIEDGGLGPYKVLILPMSYALSDKEVEQIEKFVEQGGILIADALPGVMDNHTKFRSNRALADVFGIKARAYAREELITPDREMKLKTKKAEVLLSEDNKPELIYNEYGKGSAFLLNYFMDNYPEEKVHGTNGPALQRLKELFERENLNSSIMLTEPSGASVHNVQMYSFSGHNGTARLLGLLPEKTGMEEEIVLHIDKPVHLYDIRYKKYLGERRDFTIRIKPSVPLLYGLLQGKVESIEADAPSTIKCGEKLKVDFRLVGKRISDLKSVAHIDVINPKGQMVNYYSKNYDIINGNGEFGFTTALDDLPGLWKIRISETISGMEKEIIVNIE